MICNGERRHGDRTRVPIRVWIARSTTTRDAVTCNGERQHGDRTRTPIRVWIAPSTTPWDAVKFNGERRHGIARKCRFRRDRQRLQPRRGPRIRSRTDAAEQHARALATEMHSTSTGFGDRISTSRQACEWNARSRVRLECAASKPHRRPGMGTQADTRPDRAPTLTIERHSASSEFRGRISTPRYVCGSIADPHAPLECAALRISRNARNSAPRKPHAQSVGGAHRSKAQHFSSLRSPVVHTLHRASGRVRPHSPVKYTACRVVWRPGYPQPTMRENLPPAHRAQRQRRFTHLPAISVECREAPADSASGRALTAGIHSISSTRKPRLSTSAPTRTAPASAVTRQSNGRSAPGFRQPAYSAERRASRWRPCRQPSSRQPSRRR